MATKHASWYSKPTSADQALIISEGDGADIAVVYDKANGPLLAAAPAMLAALKDTEEMLTSAARAFYVAGSRKALQEAFDGWKEVAARARAAIDEATAE